MASLILVSKNSPDNTFDINLRHYFQILMFLFLLFFVLNYHSYWLKPWGWHKLYKNITTAVMRIEKTNLVKSKDTISTGWKIYVKFTWMLSIFLIVIDNIWLFLKTHILDGSLEHKYNTFMMTYDWKDYHHIGSLTWKLKG